MSALREVGGRGVLLPPDANAMFEEHAVSLHPDDGELVVRGFGRIGDEAEAAVTSGAVTSGVGYSLWYSALPSLGSTRAAIVQLLVPMLAMIAGVFVLSEPWSARAVGSGALTLTGVGVAILGRGSRDP